MDSTRAADDDGEGGPLRALGPLAFFAAVAVVFHWPLAIVSGEAVSLRGDYHHNIWNMWWFRTALFERGVSPYWCDALYQPFGISLARHTLSPLNAALGGALSGVMDLHGAFRVLLLAHATLSGWCAYLLARELTGCRRGATIAGLLWAVSPYHAHHLAQLNLLALEFLPLALLFMVRTWRRGGVGNTLGVAAAGGLLAASAEYYLVYAALLGGLLLVAGRSISPKTDFVVGARRLLVAAAGAAAAAALVAWPLIETVFASAGTSAPTEQDPDVLSRASNDLLGFRWIFGPPEKVVVSWPTMLGYGGIALVLAGLRGVLRQPFWWSTGLCFWVLSLGPTLLVGGEDTEIPLVYGWLLEVPGLDLMLRKPSRLFVVSQLCFALCCAFAWRDVSRRLGDAARRKVVFLVVLAALGAELWPGPLSSWELPVSDYARKLGETPGDEVVLDLPVLAGTHDGRTLHHQTVHGRPIVRGYVTSLALTPELREDADRWMALNESFALEGSTELFDHIRERGIDLVVMHKTVQLNDTDVPLDVERVWAPFCVSGPRLVRARQRGPIRERPVERKYLRAHRQGLRAAFGAPIHDDDLVIVFRVR